MNRLALIKQIVRARREEQESAEVVLPSRYDIEEEASLLPPMEREKTFEDHFLAEAFEGFGQG